VDKIKNFLFLLVLMGGLVACSIEEAQPLAHKKLVIASDFLYPKDARYFSEFAKEKKVKVEIIHMRADSMEYRLKKDGYNTEIDLVFVHSLISVKQLENQAFQAVQNDFHEQKLDHLKQIDKNWFLVGRDPFIITYLKDSLEKPTTYRELSSDYLWASPDLASLEVMKAQVRYQFQQNKNAKKNGLKKWLRGLKDHRVNYQEGTKTSPNRQLLLMKYSAYFKNKELDRSKKRVLLFPPNTYNDYFAVAIVPQARNYEMTKSFLLFWNEKATSNQFLRRFGIKAMNPYKKGMGFYISPTEILALLS
jgi:hypothetical protein